MAEKIKIFGRSECEISGRIHRNTMLRIFLRNVEIYAIV